MQVNEYFDGNVKSIALQNTSGRFTVGVMAVGNYEFSTSENERMQVISGELLVKLPGAEDYTAYPSGSEFCIPSAASFQLQVKQPTAYLCQYG